MAYTPTHDDFKKVFTLTRKGATQKDCAVNLGISLSTFKRKIDLFEPYIKKGKELNVLENLPKIENKLISRCLGETYEEVTTESIIDIKTQKVTGLKKKTVTKRIPPSDVAIIFYLCNNSEFYTNGQNKEKADFDDYESEFDIVERLHDSK